MLLESPPRDEKLSHHASPHSEKKQTYSLPTLISYWLGPVFIVTCHIGSLLAFYTGLSLGAWLWIAFLYWIRMLAITGIYHRLLTHKAYSSPALVKWIGSFIASSAGQMGPNWWKAHHEEHHRFADEPQDPHSSVRGIQWSHYQWLLSKNFLPAKLPPDVEQDVVLKAIDRLHFVPTIALASISYIIGGMEYLAAFFVSTTILFHCVALVNSACHKFGTTPFKASDYSKNNSVVAVLTLGEGWHNCHHAFPWSARQGITFEEGEVKHLPDFTFGFIKLLQLVGLASKIKLPSYKDIAASAR